MDEFREQRKRMVVAQHQSGGAPTWTVIGLVMLPGLMAFGSSWVVSAREAVPILGLVLCATLVAASFLRSCRLPVWSYTTLGVALGVLVRPFWPLGLLFAPLAVLTIVYWFRRQNLAPPRSAWILICLMAVIDLLRPAILAAFPNHHLHFNLWDLAGAGAMLSLVALGLPLARRGGIMASLFVLGACFVLYEEALDFTYGLWKTPWGIVMMSILALALLIVAPVWMLRARTSRWRLVGELLPAAIALLCIVTINTLVRTQPSTLDNILNLSSLVPATAPPWIGVGTRGVGEFWPMLLGDGMTASQLFLGLVLSAVLYSQVRGKDVPAAEALEQSRAGNPSCPAMQEATGDLANLT